MFESGLRDNDRLMRRLARFRLVSGLRFTICGLMVLTLAVAVSSNLYVVCQGYRVEAERNQELARHWNKLASLVKNSDSIEMSAFHSSLAAKYERLASYPWLPSGDEPLPPWDTEKPSRPQIQLASQAR